MALPASGQISIGDIRTELSNTGTNDFRLSYAGTPASSGATRTSGYVPINQNSATKPDPASPYSISEWYSYNHSTNRACSGSPFSTLTLGAYYLYYRVNVTGNASDQSIISINSPDYASGTLRCQIYTSYPFTNTGTVTGSPVANLSFTSTATQTYTHVLASSSQVLYFVLWTE